MSAGCTLTLRGSQPTCKGPIHPPPPCHCTLIPLNPLQASKACATWDTHTCAHIVHAHTRKCPRSTFHTLCFFFSAAATPTSGHRFPAHSFHQPVFSLSAAFLKDWQGLPPDRAIMPRQIYGVDPALHFSQIPPSKKTSSTVRNEILHMGVNTAKSCYIHMQILKHRQMYTQTDEITALFTTDASNIKRQRHRGLYIGCADALNFLILHIIVWILQKVCRQTHTGWRTHTLIDKKQV